MISGSAQASSDSRRLRARRGEHLPDDLEPDDEVLRPGSGAMVRGVGDDADHPAGDAQGDAQIRPQTDPPAVLDLRGGLGGEIGGNIGKHDDPPRPQRTKVPGERRPRAARRGLDVTAGDRAQDLEGPIVAHEFTEGAAVEPEEVDQPLEGTRDLVDHPLGGEIGEEGRQIPQQSLESKALDQRHVPRIGRGRDLGV